MFSLQFTSGELVTLTTILATLLVNLANRRESRRRFAQNQSALQEVHILVNSQKQALEVALSGAVTQVQALEVLFGNALARIRELEGLVEGGEPPPAGSLHLLRPEPAANVREGPA